MSWPSVSDLVKGTRAKASHYRNGVIYYEVVFNDNTFQFPVEVEPGVTFKMEEKAITLMRWIRIAHEKGEIYMLKRNGDGT